MCRSAADCTAIVSDGTSHLVRPQSTDFGQSWQQEGNLPQPVPVGANDLSCVAGGTCLDAGYVPTSNGHGQGAVAVSADGGQTWTAATVPSGFGVLHSATCMTVSLCLAVGTTSTTVSDVVPAKGELLCSADGGHTWAPATARPPVDDVYGLACPTAQLCAMAGTTWSGTRPSASARWPRASTAG